LDSICQFPMSCGLVSCYYTLCKCCPTLHLLTILNILDKWLVLKLLTHQIYSTSLLNTNLVCTLEYYGLSYLMMILFIRGNMDTTSKCPTVSIVTSVNIRTWGIYIQFLVFICSFLHLFIHLSIPNFVYNSSSILDRLNLIYIWCGVTGHGFFGVLCY
jgi:hypothetical protein